MLQASPAQLEPLSLKPEIALPRPLQSFVAPLPLALMVALMGQSQYPRLDVVFAYGEHEKGKLRLERNTMEADDEC